MTDALGHVTAYSYDVNQNRTGMTDANGHVTTYAYDAAGRLIQMTDPLSHTTGYKYNAAGNVISATDANGSTNGFAYDALHRLTAISYAGGASVGYTYDANGNRNAMTDDRGTTTYTYDALDRLVGVTNPDGSAVSYAYDALGNRTRLTLPSGKVVTYTYNAINRLQTVKDWNGKVTGYTYDAANNLIGSAYPNNTAATFTYDNANRLLQIQNTRPSGVISRFTYTLDAVGNRLTMVDASNQTTSYTYDTLYQLTSAAYPNGYRNNVTYDAVGNRLRLDVVRGTTPLSSLVYTYDAGERLLSDGRYTYTYDNNGNLIRKTAGTTILNYTYNAANRLIGYSGMGKTSSYAYDGDGNRIRQTVNGNAYTYLNDVAMALPVVLSENGPDGAIDYLYGLGLISETSPAFQYFYHYDGLGSVINLSDASGAVKATYAYNPWGQQTTATDPLGTKNKFKYTGEAMDPNTGFYYLRARYYDATMGRFVSRDAFPGLLSQPLTLNRYTYVANNPVKLIDPSGLSPIESRGRVLGASTSRVSNISKVPNLDKEVNKAIANHAVWETLKAGAEWVTKGGGRVVEGIKGALTLKKASDFFDKATQDETRIERLNRIYANGGEKALRIDDAASAFGPGGTWEQLSQEEKAQILLEVEATLGGGFYSGYLLPWAGEEILLK